MKGLLGWRQRLTETIRRDRFLRRLALLSGGTVIGQAVTLLVSPLLTRLFTPAEFGLLGVFVALCLLPSAIMVLRYELAIPVCRDDAEAARITMASLLVGAVMAALIGLGVLLLHGWLTGRMATPGLETALWLLPVSLLFWGWSLPLSAWSIRRGTFRANAAGKVLQMLAQAVAQLGLGLAGSGAIGLVLGYALGHLARCAYFVRHLGSDDRALLRAARPAGMLRSLREHWRYPLYSSPSALLQNAALSLPALLLATLYGPAVAGWFTLAQRLLEAPVLLLSTSASAAYLGELRELDAAGIRRLFLRTAGRFLALGLLGMGPLLLVAPPLFALAFGEEWRTSGVMVQCLIPAQLARFVVTPITQTLNVYRRQDLHLVSAGINFVALGAGFGLAWYAGLGPVATLLLFSLGSCLAYLVYLLLAWRVIRAATAAGVRPHGSAAAD